MSVDVEEWREVFDGFYEVSSLGNVRRAKPGIATFVGRPVQPVASATGYMQVTLRSNAGSQQRAYVHRVVAAAFLGPCPQGYVVNHRDLDKQNNALSNLEYVSIRDNAMHALRVGRRRRGPTKPRAPLKGIATGDRHWTRRKPERIARGERMGTAKLTEEQVRSMRKQRAEGKTVRALAEYFGVCIAQVSRILRGQRWAHITK